MIKKISFIVLVFYMHIGIAKERNLLVKTGNQFSITSKMLQSETFLQRERVFFLFRVFKRNGFNPRVLSLLLSDIYKQDEEDDDDDIGEVEFPEGLGTEDEIDDNDGEEDQEELPPIEEMDEDDMRESDEWSRLEEDADDLLGEWDEDEDVNQILHESGII